MGKITLLFFLTMLTADVVAFSLQKSAAIDKSKASITLRMASSGSTGAIFTASKIHVFSTAEQVSDAVCSDFVDCVSKAITLKGSCYCAIPSGSALKMLSKLKFENGVDWSKVYLFYVSQKLTSPTDPSSTHFKAKAVFIDSIDIPAENVFAAASTDETKGHNSEANFYQKKIFELVPKVFEMPTLDYILLNVGKDGSIGGLHPDSKEVQITDPSQLILPITKANPSISMSLSLINAAKNVRVALCGPDKSELVLEAILKTKSTVQNPACGLKFADWFVDKAAASKLPDSVQVLSY